MTDRIGIDAEQIEWRDVYGYEGIYVVSSNGDVKPLKKSKLLKGEYLKQRENPGGYPIVQLVKNGKMKNRTVHSVVLEAFVCPRPDGLEADHIDRNIKNNNYKNLQWITHKENIIKKGLQGGHLSGESHARSKLKEWMVREIKMAKRRAEEKGIYQWGANELAKKFEVSPSTICDVANGYVWRNVT
jgi:hypothetical protein